MMKLAVGIRDIPHLHRVQAERARSDAPLRHRTRMFPRRAAEVIDGGSMFWVIAGAVLVRQRVLDVIEDRREDGTACAGILLDPALVPLQGRLAKPFQGWRYLRPDDAPLDVADQAQPAGDVLPVQLTRELRALCLL